MASVMMVNASACWTGLVKLANSPLYAQPIAVATVYVSTSNAFVTQALTVLVVPFTLVVCQEMAFQIVIAEVLVSTASVSVTWASMVMPVKSA